MKLQHSHPAGLNAFTAYGEDYVMVGASRYGHAVVVTPEQVKSDWRPESFDKLDESHFDYFLELQPEILLLGTGPRQQFPHPGLYRQLITAGIGIECMDTAAACRTFNILVAESRKVVAAILL